MVVIGICIFRVACMSRGQTKQRAIIKTYGNKNFCNSTVHSESSIYFGHEHEKNQRVRDLSLTNPEDDRREILEQKDPVLKGSCLWICEDPAFVRSGESDTSGTLWIHADPGKGKTMIMMALVDEVSKQESANHRLVFLLSEHQ